MTAGTDSGAIFSGAAYTPDLDRARLTAQIERIRSYMLDAGWRSLREIKIALERTHAPAVFPESSISAQLRNLKKSPHSYRLEKRRREGVRGPGAGIWEYRLLRPTQIDFAFSASDVRPPRTARSDVASEPDDGRGREEFFRAARRIAGLQ
jgi:hypothetical protein